MGKNLKDVNVHTATLTEWKYSSAAPTFSFDLFL
jgi:hypothetical protein